MRVACLHTSPDNVRLFEAASPEGIDLIHHVRSDLLKRASIGLDDGLATETRMLLNRLGRNADAVLLTCSSLRSAACEDVYSADAILAQHAAAVSADKSLEVFYTNPGSSASTLELFADLQGPAETRVIMVDNAWEHYENGESNEYFFSIADAIGRSSADVVAFAQASMTPATAMCTREVLEVPQAAMSWLAQKL